MEWREEGRWLGDGQRATEVGEEPFVVLEGAALVRGDYHRSYGPLMSHQRAKYIAAPASHHSHQPRSPADPRPDIAQCILQ